ncbi:hypothetical protein BDW72DRAFT_207534 [Aspergillus terricola var. indicus]
MVEHELAELNYGHGSKHPYSSNNPTNPHAQLHCQEGQSRRMNPLAVLSSYLPYSVASLAMPRAMYRGQVDPAPMSARHEEAAGPMEARILRGCYNQVKPNQPSHPPTNHLFSKCLPAPATAAPATATPALAAPAPTKYLFCRVVLCPCSATSTSQMYLNQATTHVCSSIRP